MLNICLYYLYVLYRVYIVFGFESLVIQFSYCTQIYNVFIMINIHQSSAPRRRASENRIFASVKHACMAC